jgi:hypothetical protein
VVLLPSWRPWRAPGEQESRFALVRYAWPLTFVALVLVRTMLVTRDMGPLLIASYAAGAFLAASVRCGGTCAPGRVRRVLAVCTFAAWIAVITLAVFDSVPSTGTAGRRTLAAPRIRQRSARARHLVSPSRAGGGFGLGAVPWVFCELFGVRRRTQIRNDYTFTALVGTFGWRRGPLRSAVPCGCTG